MSSSWQTIAFIVLASAGFGGACKKEGTAELPVLAEKAAPSMQSAFSNAAPEVKQEADAAASALAGQNETQAYVRLKSLSERPGLTPEQRRAAYEAWLVAQLRLQMAAS